MSPAGWYPCPLYTGTLRWWDGTHWTAETAAPRIELGAA
jgi:hypothetical protein